MSGHLSLSHLPGRGGPDWSPGRGVGGYSKDIKIIPLIETPLAINNLNKIAKNEKVIGLSFGAADFSSMIGSEMSWDAMLYARSKIILECSINNLISIDSPFMSIANMDAFVCFNYFPVLFTANPWMFLFW